MEEIIRFETVNQYNAVNQQETLHPLVTVIDLPTASPRKKTSQYMGCFGNLLSQTWNYSWTTAPGFTTGSLLRAIP